MSRDYHLLAVVEIEVDAAEYLFPRSVRFDGIRYVFEP